MQPISAISTNELHWHLIDNKNDRYELYSGDILIARLGCYDRRSALAVGAAKDGMWVFCRTNQNGDMVVQNAETNQPLAQFCCEENGNGTLTFADGERYHWRAANFWRTQWQWIHHSEKPLIYLMSDQVIHQEKGYVEFLAAGIKEDRITLLLIFGWYLTVLEARQANSAMMAATL